MTIFANMSWNDRHLVLRGLYVLLTVMPLAVGLITAMMYSVGLFGVVESGWTWVHWCHVLQNWGFYSSLGLSCIMATISVVISFLLAYGLTIVLTQVKQHWQRIGLWWLYWPLMMPPIVVAFVVYQLYSGTGILSRISFHLGWVSGPSDFPHMINDPLHIGVMVAMVMMVAPFLTLLLIYQYNTFQVASYVALAASLGADRWTIHTKVIAPLLLSSSLPLLFLYFVALMSAYEVPLILGMQSPSMISVHIARSFKGFDLQRLPEAYAMTVVYALLLIGLVTLMLHRLRNSKIIGQV